MQKPITNVGDTLIGSVPVASLAGGASSAARTSSAPVNVAPGTHYLVAIADKDNSQPETVETNNSLTAASTLIVKP